VADCDVPWITKFVSPREDAVIVHIDADPLRTDMPLWAFHGLEDDAVPPENSRLVIAALLGAGGSPHYTEFPEANHNAWDAAYAHGPLWTWLFAQHR
jgi:predicted peptidase